MTSPRFLPSPKPMTAPLMSGVAAVEPLLHTGDGLGVIGLTELDDALAGSDEVGLRGIGAEAAGGEAVAVEGRSTMASTRLVSFEAMSSGSMFRIRTLAAGVAGAGVAVGGAGRGRSVAHEGLRMGWGDRSPR